MMGSPAGPSIGTRSRGSESAGSGTATFSPGTRMVAFDITSESPQTRLWWMVDKFMIIQA